MIKRIICYLRGHRWALMDYEDGPQGWYYERHKCGRCGQTTRELVASKMG